MSLASHSLPSFSTPLTLASCKQIKKMCELSISILPMICYYYSGVSIAMLFFDALSPLLLIAYIKGRGLHKKTWGGWSWESLKGWSQFLKLGVAGYLMIAFEWWGFEISTLVTGSISQEQLAANTALFQFANLAYVVSLSLSLSLSLSPPPPLSIIKGTLNLRTHHDIAIYPFL